MPTLKIASVQFEAIQQQEIPQEWYDWFNQNLPCTEYHTVTDRHEYTMARILKSGLVKPRFNFKPGFN